ncbi:MAG TPA: hypothetical protein VFI78_05175 [Salinimicrobium sp.]|nr:hypothetical protein [Salinimicrobium sp.]
MKKLFLGVLIAVFTLSIYSCRETTTEVNVEEPIEEVGNDIEEAADEVGDEIDQAAEEVDEEVDVNVDVDDEM